MNSRFVLVGLLGVALCGCGDSGKQKSPGAQGTGDGNPLTAPVDYLGAAGRAKILAEKTVDLAGISQAIQIFVAQEGRYPKSLDELVEQQLLTQIPKPPYGMKIVYDPQNGKVVCIKDEATPVPKQ
jgi:hypothetical protein